MRYLEKSVVLVRYKEIEYNLARSVVVGIYIQKLKLLTAEKSLLIILVANAPPASGAVNLKLLLPYFT
jgi:hypothetical protein